MDQDLTDPEFKKWKTRLIEITRMIVILNLKFISNSQKNYQEKQESLAKLLVVIFYFLFSKIMSSDQKDKFEEILTEIFFEILVFYENHRQNENQ